jgi:hypothetical protein
VKISNKFFSFFPSLNQYFPHIPYVASKKQGFSDKKISVCYAPLPFAKICTTPTVSPLQARKLKFWLPKYFGPT